MSAPSYVPVIVPEPGRHLAETLLAAIERQAGAHGWDGPNRLYVLDRVPLGIGVKEFPFTGELKMHPAVLCGLFAAHFRQSGASALGDGWRGFVIAVETWSIMADTAECSYLAQLVPGEVGNALRQLVDDVATLRGTS